MAIINNSNITYYHDQNKRRKRFGFRARRIIARKNNIYYSYNESYSDSRDANPRPLLYQDFD